MTLYIRLAIAALIAGALAGLYIKGHSDGTRHAQEQCASERAASERAAQEQAERNRELQRAAETRYVVQQDARERFIVTTVKELSHASEPLASCAVPADVVRLLNSTRGCALGDSASCGSPDGAVPRP